MRSALCLSLLLITICSVGCSRTRYRTAADRDSYQIIQEKAACIATPMPSYQVTPDPRSRFYDATNPDCPQLPVPRPVLNGYTLPELVTEVQNKGGTDSHPLPDPSQSDALQSNGPQSLDAKPTAPAISPTTGVYPSQETANVSAAIPLSIAGVQGNDLAIQSPVTAANYDQQAAATVRVAEQIDSPEEVQAKAMELEEEQVSQPKGEQAAQATRTNVPSSTNTVGGKVAIPKPAWEVLPKNCLERMLEFQSLQTEYANTFGRSERPLAATSRSEPRRLTLPNLMELATINSREYQTRKEVLYATALALTRRRYQFELNPTPFGNGTAADFRHSRNNGVTQNQLGVPSGVGVQKSLATGGEFLARFANSVVLTFNGPSGFATDIGSEMIFDFQQTVFQRDVRFETLTQAERDVIYATRDYLRFRKQLFRDVADQYYTLLLNYRSIEINAQDYFTNLRGFIQSQAEYRTAEKIPRIQVDQFEQNVLRTRGNLVSNCFALDTALDQLEFRLGLPIEMPLYLELTELKSISLKDELSVARQMIGRARAELLNARSSTMMDTTTLANVAEVLADRMSNILTIQEQMESVPVADTTTEKAATVQSLKKASAELNQLQRLLQILGVRMQVDMLREELNAQLRPESPAPPLRVLIRAIDYCATQLQVIDLSLKDVDAEVSSSTQDSKDQSSPAQMLARRTEAREQLDRLIAFVDKISSSLSRNVAASAIVDLDKIPDRMQESVKLADELEKLALEATKEILTTEGESIEAKVQSTVDRTIELSDRLLEKGPDGWEEIVMDPNEAMLTGLVQRLDLMNQRGDLADAWRQIKLAGDDLRSIVDLRATQALRTRSTGTNPFDFTFDDSETRLSVALDTPLNRRVQRNNFRVALISYNVGLRNLMAAEDSIKLDVRQDLRQLALDRNQYSISVASAALAYERVISTRLRLQYGVANVAARDFLEAQQAYTNALSSIARQHVNYITDRTELFFDLEAFDVDQWGHWSGVADDNGPQVNLDFPNSNPRPYDCLPPRVWYSPTIRQMEHIPPGEAIIQQPATGGQ